MDYKSTGVDTEGGQLFIGRLKERIQSTHGPEVIGGIGGFGALFQPNLSGMKEPVLVSGTDGVGTKIELARQHQKFDGIGLDLVAMCANDILTLGARPLFFLDYMATGSLSGPHNEPVVAGIAAGCTLSEMALIGGETAEHPGVMEHSEFDLAGFCVGIVDKSKIIDGPGSITEGMAIVGLTSSGPHSNGFSLIRRILERAQQIADGTESAANEVEAQAAQSILQSVDSLLEPTHIYCPLINGSLLHAQPAGMVHLTGGGFFENIPRVLPAHLGAAVDLQAWQIPQLFADLAAAGPVVDEEMFAVFNMGIGYLWIGSEPEAQKFIDYINERSAEHAQWVHQQCGLTLPEVQAIRIGTTYSLDDATFKNLQPALPSRHKQVMLYRS